MTVSNRSQRQDRFQRNDKLENLLTELAGLLDIAEKAAVAEEAVPQHPTVFVVGPPRSGTTLMIQWLAATGVFAYPTNLLSRFYGSPYIGARIQQLLTDPEYQYGGELYDLGANANVYASELGKTSGTLQPNEFWYFWRRFIPNDQPRPLSEDEEQRVDVNGFRRGIAALQKAFGKPFALKGIILQYNLPLLAAIFPKALFIHTHREMFYNVQSLLQARIKYYGTINSWYSVQPPGTAQLRQCDPYQQVAGQVQYTNESIRKQFEEIPAANNLTVSYESFCADPSSVYIQLRDRMLEFGYELPAAYDGPSSFECMNSLRDTPLDSRSIEQACRTIVEQSTSADRKTQT